LIAAIVRGIPLLRESDIFTVIAPANR